MFGGESFGPFGDSISKFYKQLQFEPSIATEVLQVPMSQGQLGLNRLSPLCKLHLGDVLHHSTRNKFIRSQMESTKSLHKKLLEVVVDETLSDAK